MPTCEACLLLSASAQHTIQGQISLRRMLQATASQKVDSTEEAEAYADFCKWCLACMDLLRA